MGFFSDLVKSEAARERERKANALRDAEMKRRREQRDADDKARIARINEEIDKIRQQADGRKSGWLW